MGVHDEDKFLWLVREKRAIEKAIRRGKIVIGICLGAQLIATPEAFNIVNQFMDGLLTRIEQTAKKMP